MRYVELTEKWSKKYKGSINCNNPKGFSQKAHCAGRKKVNESEMNDLVYFNKDQLDKSIEEVEAYKQHHIEDGWKNIQLENPPENDSEATKDELVTITNIQAKRTKEDENSIYVSDKMDSFHFREYLNANNLDYSSAEITAIIDDVWKVTRIFKNKFNRPRPYQMAEAYNMEFETMHGTSNKTPAYPSGHSCGATLLALYLSKKHPEHKEQFKDIAEKIGVGRIQAGFHYPSDHVSGVDLAFKVFPYLKISPQHLKESEQTDITAQELQQLETYADRLFASLGIDIEFSKHFKDRLNDPRNQKPITMAELTRLFRQVYKQHGKPIAQLGPDAEAVMKDMRTDVNIPFTLQWDGKELDLVAKTIMRKPHFSTPNQEFAVENFADGKKKGKSRPGRVKRAGASCKGSVTSLRSKAKKASGEKAKMYHWCANMKSGRNK